MLHRNHTGHGETGKVGNVKEKFQGMEKIMDFFFVCENKFYRRSEVEADVTSTSQSTLNERLCVNCILLSRSIKQEISGME